MMRALTLSKVCGGSIRMGRGSETKDGCVFSGTKRMNGGVQSMVVYVDESRSEC
jgi:hypothetical protein